MRKLILMFALMCGVMSTSCGNTVKNAEQADTTAVDTMSIDTISVDTLAVDSLQ